MQSASDICEPDDQCPTVLFRADASPSIGTGHLMRCMALAEIFRERGYRPVFAVAECPAVLVDRLDKAGIGVCRLGDGSDVVELCAVIGRIGPAAIVVDGYQFAPPYRAAAAAQGRPVIALDDGTDDAPLYADLVINPSPLANAAGYRGAPGSRLFLGPAFAPLRREFLEADGRRDRADKGSRLLLTLGGSDTLGLSGPVIEQILKHLPAGPALDVVIGGATTDDAEVGRLALDAGGRIILHRDTRDMAGLMSGAALAVSAAGSTLWELARMQVPSIAVVVADNQAAALRSPMSEWFVAIDARCAPKKAAQRIAAAIQTMWLDADDRARRAATLGQIEVGSKVASLFDAIDLIQRA